MPAELVEQPVVDQRPMAAVEGLDPRLGHVVSLSENVARSLVKAPSQRGGNRPTFLLRRAPRDRTANQGRALAGAVMRTCALRAGWRSACHVVRGGKAQHLVVPALEESGIEVVSGLGLKLIIV